MDKQRPKNASTELQNIVESLKTDMASLRPGQRLIELQLCKRFGASRSKIREALRQAEQDGFVNIIPNVGAVVVEFSQKDIEQTYDLLGILEGLAVRVAVASITEEHLQKIEALMHRMATAESGSVYFDYNKEFHSYLTSLCNNDRLIKFADNLRNHVRCFYYRESFHPFIDVATNEHRLIFQAIKEKKAARVEQLIRAHYLKSRTRYVKYMNKSL